MKTAVITGATSMIGSAIVDACLSNDIKTIYAVVREGTVKLSHIPDDDRIKLIYCNADDYASLPEKINEKCDVFYHIAWSLTGAARNKNSDEQARNINFVLEALEAAHNLGCELFVGAGSQAEYGVLDLKKISPDSPNNPVQAYGIAKYAAGKLALQKAEALGINCAWVRIFSIYGKWEKPNTLIQTTIKALKNNETPDFTEGIQLWDFLYSEDAGKAFYQIGEKVRKNAVYCLGSGEARKLREYIEILRDAVNPDAKLNFGAIPYGDKPVLNICADITTLTEDTGWKPETDFKDGINKTLSFVE
ncbi:MAG: NAD(P)-dependent oxidoreductase [Ruminococcus sp.]|nr:NAD(P)-dependent oxidoreductase [Ruminococcus sp.]